RAWWRAVRLFFQAGDGIRAFHVTGVQTCALPIFGHPAPPPPACWHTWSVHGLRVALGALIGFGVLMLLPPAWAHVRSARRIRSTTDVPETDVALVLGAGVRWDGQPSRIPREIGRASCREGGLRG